MSSNHQELISRIFSEVDQSSLCITPLHDNPEVLLRWLKIIEFQEIRLILGIAEDGHWLRVGNADINEFIPGEYILSLLPCLEMPASEFFAASLLPLMI